VFAVALEAPYDYLVLLHQSIHVLGWKMSFEGGETLFLRATHAKWVEGK
jgi:hypothetical protein